MASLMPRAYRAALDRFRSVPPARAFVPDAARDIFLASYPRSGNTWLRAVAFRLEIGRDPASLAELDFAVPDIHFKFDVTKLFPLQRYIVKTHSMLQSDQEYRNVIYVIRDPRRVLPSFYRYHCNAYGYKLEFQAFARDCLAGRYWPGSWFDHVMAWTHDQPAAIASLEILRYEDLVARAPAAIAGVARCLQRDVDEVDWVANHFSLEKMRQLEFLGNRKGLARRQGWFIGSGGSGNELAATVNYLITQEFPFYCELMARWGYSD